MTHLAKLTFKTVSKSIPRDPVIARRDKVIAALGEQALVLAAALEGQDHIKLRSKWMMNDQRNVSTTLRQWLLDFRLGFLRLVLVG